MDSNLFGLCKLILIWWESVYDEYHGQKEMPEFVRLALEILGGAIVNVTEEELE